MQVTVLLAFFTLLGMSSCAPLEAPEDRRSTSNGFQMYLIDGVDISELPERFRNIATMCDIFKKLNLLTNDRLSDIKIGVSSTENPVDYKITSLGNLFKKNSFQRSDLVKNVREGLDETTSDISINGGNIGKGLTHSNCKSATRKERVKRNNVSNFPAELAKLLEGVCLTDECIQVLKDYLKWRQQNGYPVYTGVTNIGK